MIAAYESALQGRPEIEVLKALGYFDRPAEKPALDLVLPPGLSPLDYKAALAYVERLMDQPSPDEAELAHARAVIEAFAAPENAGKGAIRVEGKMAELLHLEQAKRLVAVAEKIAALS